MSNKESVNYKNKNTVVVSRSPVFKANKVTNKVVASSLLIGNKTVTNTIGKTLRNSIVHNINSVNNVLNESNKILPYKNNLDISTNRSKFQLKGKTY
ncbi:hypothetical protein ACFVAD_08860 [Sutcliffiella sp. NPDC057660]|uniref:hypothetical protein n=1 Tax=Sutcliffiella sp. NPDC057660 TaxID=3346199 RepID=UPI0036933754